MLSLNKLKEDITSALAKIDALNEELKADKSEIISKLHQEAEDVESKINEKASDISNVIDKKSHEIINIESENKSILSAIKSALDTVKNEQDNSWTQLNAILEQQKKIKTISIITLIIIVLGFAILKFM